MLQEAQNTELNVPRASLLAALCHVLGNYIIALRGHSAATRPSSKVDT